MINVIALAIYYAQLALVGIILFYVIGMLTMPENMKKVCQALLVLIFLLAAIATAITESPPPGTARSVIPLPPIPPGPAPIVRPER